MHSSSIIRSARVCLAASTLVCAASISGALAAPPDKANDKAKGQPIVIRDQGNFYVNAEKVQTPYNDTCKTAAGCSGIAPFPGGTIGIIEAYVDYQFPQNQKFKYPIILTHGGGHHGGYYELTQIGARAGAHTSSGAGSTRMS